ncbi:MAG: Aspartate-semialdehyde dehydrogenase, partial [uncultured Frankineae bacterium]
EHRSARRRRRGHRSGRRGRPAPAGRAVLPPERAAAVRERPVGRVHAALRRARGRRRGRLDRRPHRARPRRLLGRRRHLEAAGTEVRRRRRRGRRQLLRLAHGPRRAARRERGQPARAGRRAQGHRGQPQLHHHGGDAGAQAAARRGRPRPDRGEHLPGSVRERARRRGGARRPDPQDRGARDRAGARRLGRRLPRAGQVRRADRLQRPADGRLPRRRRVVRDRRGAEAPQREPQDPGDPRPAGLGHLRARPGLQRSLAVAQRRVRAAAVRGRGDGPAARRPGRRAVGRADAAAGCRARPELRRTAARGRAVGAGAVRQQRQPAQGSGPQRRPDRRAARRLPDTHAVAHADM